MHGLATSWLRGCGRSIDRPHPRVPAPTRFPALPHTIDALAPAPWVRPVQRAEHLPKRGQSCIPGEGGCASRSRHTAAPSRGSRCSVSTRDTALGDTNFGRRRSVPDRPLDPRRLGGADTDHCGGSPRSRIDDGAVIPCPNALLNSDTELIPARDAAVPRALCSWIPMTEAAVALQVSAPGRI